VAPARARAAQTLADAPARRPAPPRKAADEMSWTRTTVDALVAAAGAEADAIRLRGHGDAARHLAAVRRRIQDVVHRVGARMGAQLDEAEERAAEIRTDARQQLADAEESAARQQAEAEERARRVEADAGDRAARLVERAERRSSEAESHAGVMRSAVADEVVRLRAEASEELRNARGEAAETLSRAQSEAEELRATARRLLDEARAEVTELRERRDRITGELSQLSGVIEALAVPDDQRPTPHEESPEESA
jgi:chromosome segregation ATPase